MKCQIVIVNIVKNNVSIPQQPDIFVWGKVNVYRN